MSDLLRQIHAAQVRAGEDAVIRNLQAMGLAGEQAKPVVAEVEAVWSITLDATCPSCNEDVDLVSHCEFWIDRRLEAGENGTPQSDNLKVVCPKCDHRFRVRCVY